MKDLNYDFVELESDASFRNLGKAFGGTFNSDTLFFDNALVKGELVKMAPEKGLWIRKWKLTVFDKVTLHRRVAVGNYEKRFNLLFFLHPSIFELKKDLRKLLINSQKNVVFTSNDSLMDFSVVPKQPFYVIDIMFDASWLGERAQKPDDPSKSQLIHQLIHDSNTMIMEPCPMEEYKTLYELDGLMQTGGSELSLIGLHTHELIDSFLTRLSAENKMGQHKRCYHYDEIMEAASIIAMNLNSPPKIAELASKVNMSSSTLLRHFRLVFGRSVQKFYLQKKMELARQMILDSGHTVKMIAEILGYTSSSPFIETFTKHFGYSPGTLKTQCES